MNDLMFLKCIISSRIGCCDCLPWPSKNLAMPLPPWELQN